MVNSLLIVCGVFNKQGVEYLIVGGTAVALHGYYRQSMNAAGVIAEKPDLDFWYNPTYSNYFRVLKALAELGQDVSRFKQEQSPNPRKSFFKYEFEQFTLDLLPELRASLKFGASFNNREIITIHEVDMPFISFEDLIADKEANARPKDIMDIEELKRKKRQSEL